MVKYLQCFLLKALQLGYKIVSVGYVCTSLAFSNVAGRCPCQ